MTFSEDTYWWGIFDWDDFFLLEWWSWCNWVEDKVKPAWLLIRLLTLPETENLCWANLSTDDENSYATFPRFFFFLSVIFFLRPSADEFAFCYCPLPAAGYGTTMEILLLELFMGV